MTRRALAAVVAAGPALELRVVAFSNFDVALAAVFVLPVILDADDLAFAAVEAEALDATVFLAGALPAAEPLLAAEGLGAGEIALGAGADVLVVLSEGARVDLALVARRELAFEELALFRLAGFFDDAILWHSSLVPGWSRDGGAGGKIRTPRSERSCEARAG